MKRMLPIVVLLLVAASPLYADVKVVSHITGSGMAQMLSGDETMYVKGLKLRTEQPVMGSTLVVILDLDAGKLIALDAQKKQATVTDLKQLAQQTGQATGSSAMTVSFLPNGQTKTVSGRVCNGFDATLSTTAGMGRAAAQGEAAGESRMVAKGPVWIAKDAPGTADFVAFFNAAVARGVFGRQAPGSGNVGLSELLFSLYQAAFEKGQGLWYQLDLTFSFEGPAAEMMKAMSGITVSQTVTDVSIAPLDDALFAIPEGYAVR